MKKPHIITISLYRLSQFSSNVVCMGSSTGDTTIWCKHFKKLMFGCHGNQFNIIFVYIKKIFPQMLLSIKEDIASLTLLFNAHLKSTHLLIKIEQ